MKITKRELKRIIREETKTLNEKISIEDIDFNDIYTSIKRNNFKLDKRSDNSGDYIIMDIDNKIKLILYKDTRLNNLDSWISLL